MTIAETSDLVERLIIQSAEISSAGHNGWGNTMLDAAESLASAQRGKESAERDLEESQKECAELRGALYDEQHGITATLRNDRMQKLQKERDRLAARLAAAEARMDYLQTFVRQTHGQFFANIGNELYLSLNHSDLRKHCDLALSSSPSTSAVAEGEK